jgi:hypothetical protein
LEADISYAGESLNVLEGEWAPKRFVIIEFPSVETGQGVVEFAIVCRTEKDPPSHGEVELLCG